MPAFDKEIQMRIENGIKLYENLGEIIDPAHSCLVVWDVQNGLIDKIYNKDEFLSNLVQLIEKLRPKMPVVYTLITPVPAEYNSSWRCYQMMRPFNLKSPSQMSSFMAVGSKEREIPAVIKPQDKDLVLDKPAASIFIGTNFENLMRNRGVHTLVFTGIATEIGVESSARDASNRGFFPVVVSDCVSSASQEAHERSLKNLAKIVIVEKSGDILSVIK